MKELTNPEIEKLNQEKEKLYDKIDKINDKIKNIKSKVLNLDWEGKYIKYTDIFENTIYMVVETVMQDRTRYPDKDFSYLFRGLGFSGEFTGYGDATSFYWDYWYEFYIYGDEKDFLSKIDRIEEISKEEFNTKFDEQVNKLKEYHYECKHN